MNISGLTQKQVQQALEKYGENKLKEKREYKAVRIWLSQFQSPMIYILVLAGGVTWWLRDFTDAGIITGAVVLNTVLGFFQEIKAEKSLEALKKILTPKTKVIRDGKRQVIDSTQVVPGDIGVLEIGEKVAADGVVVESDSLSLNEAILTGESTLVEKKNQAEVFSGTVVAGGIGKMRVTKTGSLTALGAIAESLKETKEERTPLQKKLDQLAGKLAWMVGGICTVILVLGLMRGSSFLEIFTTSVAVGVAAIPEGLVITLTVILSIGMQRILKRRALVRKLVAAETLGSVTVICCDKTGTLTEGKMKVVKALTEDETLLRQAAVLCNDMRDPLETAMMSWGLEKYQGREARLDSLPFNHENKYIATLHPGLLLVSGAPEVILAKCKTADDRFQKEFKKEAEKGQRLVGFAYQEVSSDKKKISREEIKDLHWLGVLVYEDPVREDVKEALAGAIEMGIKIKVITGDYKETAMAVAKKLGLKTDEETIYYRTTPEQKLAIVEKLQSQGEVVAMMGDGVNDAPALKKADIGIVVAEAATVSQEIADMVLLDSNFKTILGAIEEGRAIFVNLKKVVFYLMSHVFTEILLVTASLILKLPLPLTAGQILWVNLINDSLPSFALALEPKSGSLSKQRAGGLGSLMDGKVKVLIGIISGYTSLAALGLFSYYYGVKQDLILARSVVFTLVGVAPLFSSFSIRTMDKFIFRDKLWQNSWLVLGAGISLVFQLGAIYLPAVQGILKTTGLGGREWLVIVIVSLGLIGLMETVKARFNRKI